MSQYKTIRGRGFNREEWYSICSRHKVYNVECRTCQIGKWTNVWQLRFDHVFFWLLPRTWIWWRNRKDLQEPKLIWKGGVPVDRIPPKDCV